MATDQSSKTKLEPTRDFRPAGVSIQDATISKERAGVVQTKAAAKAGAGAAIPPVSKKPIPTTPLAARVRERLKKGG